MKQAIVLVVCLFLCGCAKRSSNKETSAISSQQKTYQISFNSEKLDASQTPEGVGEAYRLTAAGLPIGQKFTLFGKNLKQEEMVINYFFVDSTGQLMTYEEGRGSYALSDILFKKGSFSKGEPYEYLLVSEDGRSKASTKIVPNPLSVTSKEGAVLSLTLVNSEATLWMFKGEHFKPGEKIELLAKSGKEILKKIIQADEKGEVAGSLLPAVAGQSKGVASITLKREKEALSLEYPWGGEK